MLQMGYCKVVSHYQLSLICTQMIHLINRLKRLDVVQTIALLGMNHLLSDDNDICTLAPPSSVNEKSLDICSTSALNNSVIFNYLK